MRAESQEDGSTEDPFRNLEASLRDTQVPGMPVESVVDNIEQSAVAISQITEPIIRQLFKTLTAQIFETGSSKTAEQSLRRLESSGIMSLLNSDDVSYELRELQQVIKDMSTVNGLPAFVDAQLKIADELAAESLSALIRLRRKGRLSSSMQEFYSTLVSQLAKSANSKGDQSPE